MKREEISARCLEEADFILTNDATIREVSAKLGYKRSTISRDMNYVLPQISPSLAEEVQERFAEHKMRWVDSLNNVYWKERRANEQRIHSTT